MLKRMFLRSAAAAIPIALVSFSAAQSVPPPKPQKPALAAWTQLVGDDHAAPDPQPAGHTVLRVITPATTCPTATTDGRPLRLSVRQAPSPAFPVTTCQASTPATARHITVAGTQVVGGSRGSCARP